MPGLETSLSATSGHAAKPPINEMNSRRLILAPRPRRAS